MPSKSIAQARLMAYACKKRTGARVSRTGRRLPPRRVACKFFNADKQPRGILRKGYQRLRPRRR